jgi:hypothetical protein
MNKETVEEAAEQYAQGNTLEFAYLQEILAFKAGAEWQKGQSATDAIEFADWCEDNYWPTGQTGLWRPEASSEEVMLTTQQLYKLWKKSK